MCASLPRCVIGGDTHNLLYKLHGSGSLKGADCTHCEHLTLRMLCYRRPYLMRAARFGSWGSQMELVEELEMGPFSALTAGSSAVTQDLEARSTASSTLSENPMLALSSFEEVDIVSIEAGESDDSPPVSPDYEELVEIVTHSVAKLNIYWPAEKQCPVKMSGPTFLSRPPHRGVKILK